MTVAGDANEASDGASAIVSRDEMMVMLAKRTGQSERMPAGRTNRTGFTLFEMLLALALTVTLLVGVWEFYTTILRVRHQGTDVTRDAVLVRSILDGMAEEIRHASNMLPGDGIGFSGTEDHLTIVYTDLPDPYAFNEYDPIRDELPPGQLDIRRVTYELLWDEENEDDQGHALCHGLWRSEQRTFDPNPQYVMEEDRPGESSEFDFSLGESDMSGVDNSPDLLDDGQAPRENEIKPLVEGELYAPEIKYLKFEYYDGAEWRDRWQVAAEPMEGEEPQEVVGNESGYVLPQAIKITIGRVPVPREEDEMDINVLEETAEREEQLEYHSDRFTIVVPVLRADRSLLSSRQFGVKNQTDRQLGGEL